MMWAVIVDGEWYLTYETFTKAQEALQRFLSFSNDEDFIKYYGHAPSYEIKEIK